MAIDTIQAQKLLEQLRQHYISELPMACDEIENLILSEGSAASESFAELYRRVHSMKGSAGTHGLTIISAICHNLEDQLNKFDVDAKSVNHDVTDLLLRHVDLIRRVTAEAETGSVEFPQIEQALQEIRQALLHNLSPALLVESSDSVKMLCQEALSHLPIELTIEEDGLVALERVLHSNFSFVITAKETKTLSGLALISAIKASDSIKDIKTILLTSSGSSIGNDCASPDYVINKNTLFEDSLTEIIKKVISG